MNFDNLFAGPAVVSKQLEKRWANSIALTDSAASSAGNEGGDGERDRRWTAKTSAPYLRRTLLYCIDPLSQPCFPRWKSYERSADTKYELPKEDMLAKLFGHTFKKKQSSPPSSSKKKKSKQQQLRHLPQPSATNPPAAVSQRGRPPTDPNIITTSNTNTTANTNGTNTNSSSGNSTPLLSTPTRKRKRRSGYHSTPSTPGTPSAQHTKLFYDVKMAQSPNVALSPTTVEMKYGKAFPPYEPREEEEEEEGGNNSWNKPEEPRSAYELFANMMRGQAERFLQRRERNDEEKVNEQLRQLWAKGNKTTLLYWKQEEEWDKQRYLHEQAVYARARQLADGFAVPAEGEEEKKDDAVGSGSAAAAGSGGSGGSGVAAVQSGGDNGQSSSQTKRNVIPRRVSSVFYHYFYLKEGIPVAQIERRNDCRCPLCFQNCVTDVGLLMHCQLVHSGNLSFEGAKDEDANLHIGIRSEKLNNQKEPWKDFIDDESCVRSLMSRSQEGWDPANALRQRPVTNARLKDFIYSRGDEQPQLVEIPFFKRPFSNVADMDLVDRKKKSQTLREQGADEEVIKRLVPGDQVPIRQYYHSKTNLPMRDGEWDEDSDDEPDDAWMEKIGEELLDEFDDVSSQEKHFMKLWNRHMDGSRTIVADRSMPATCMEFIKLHGAELAELGLRQNLFLHLCNLWDEEVLSSTHVSTLMAFYDHGCKDAYTVGGCEKAKSTPPSSPRTPRSPNHHRRKSPRKNSSTITGTSSSTPRSTSATKKRARRCVAI